MQIVKGIESKSGEIDDEGAGQIRTIGCVCVAGCCAVVSASAANVINTCSYNDTTGVSIGGIGIDNVLSGDGSDSIGI
jgi:hypothetical protein